MNKLKSLIIGFLSCCTLIVPVFAATYYQNTQYFALAYNDYASNLQADSAVSALQDKPYAACVHVDHGSGSFNPSYDCGPLKTNGAQSYKHDQFAVGTYELHKHFMIDGSLNKSFVK